MYYRQFKVSLASFRSLVRSLCTAKHQSLATSKISETLGFQTQKFLGENMFTKHIISIFLLYFSIGFVNNDSPEHPITVMQTAACIYTLFLFISIIDAFY